MKKLTELKNVKSLQDLENLDIGEVYCNISGRGGGIGFYSSDISKEFEVEKEDLPNKFGAGCNYLGGGIRGSIFASDFSGRIIGRKYKLLTELANACVRVYKNLEDESEMNEESSDGETNWEAIGTKQARKANIISAY